MSHKVFVALDVFALEVKTKDAVFKIAQPVRPGSRPFAPEPRRSILDESREFDRGLASG